MDATDGTNDFGEAVADIDNLVELIWRARGVVANAFALSKFVNKFKSEFHIDIIFLELMTCFIRSKIDYLYSQDLGSISYDNGMMM